MNEGNWRLGVLIDDAASDEQAEKLGAVFGGQLGGPMGGLAPLISENLGVERVPLEFSSEGGRHCSRWATWAASRSRTSCSFGIEDRRAGAPDGDLPPGGSELTSRRPATRSVAAFGIDAGPGRGSGFSAEFSWSA